MPNRGIREGILTSDRINSVSMEAEVFYYRLLVIVDDYGLFDARPKIILPRAFPLRLDRVTVDDIQGWLEELKLAGLIILYEVEGKPFLMFEKWKERTRANKPKYPLPPGYELVEYRNKNGSICKRQIRPRDTKADNQITNDSQTPDRCPTNDSRLTPEVRGTRYEVKTEAGAVDSVDNSRPDTRKSPSLQGKRAQNPNVDNLPTYPQQSRNPCNPKDSEQCSRLKDQYRRSLLNPLAAEKRITPRGGT